VKREGNRVADALAKHGRLNGLTSFDPTLPPEIRELVMLDCTKNLSPAI
jgi:hypothetical protein